ncbi:hypothetical protein ACBZ90_01650 [Vibrio alginolyticus]
MKINGKNVVKLGDIATCVCGNRSCRGQGEYTEKVHEKSVLMELNSPGVETR